MMEKLKYLDEIAEERGISRHRLGVWHRKGMKTVRIDKLATTDEWVDEWIIQMVEEEKNKCQFTVIQQQPIKHKPLRVVGENRVY